MNIPVDVRKFQKVFVFGEYCYILSQYKNHIHLVKEGKIIYADERGGHTTYRPTAKSLYELAGYWTEEKTVWQHTMNHVYDEAMKINMDYDHEIALIIDDELSKSKKYIERRIS